MRRAALLVLFFALAVGIWATRPLHETLYVGTDWTPTLLVPPEGTKEVHVRVECNNLLASSPQSDSTPIPVLTPQPPDKPPLAYPRQPCVFVHGDARRTFAIDLVVIVAAVVLLTYARRRRLRHIRDSSQELQPELA